MSHLSCRIFRQILMLPRNSKFLLPCSSVTRVELKLTSTSRKLPVRCQVIHLLDLLWSCRLIFQLCLSSLHCLQCPDHLLILFWICQWILMWKFDFPHLFWIFKWFPLQCLFFLHLESALFEDFVRFRCRLRIINSLFLYSSVSWISFFSFGYSMNVAPLSFTIFFIKMYFAVK